MNYIVEEMDKLGADGVDFVPVCMKKEAIERIFLSKTRQQMIDDPSYPKSGRLYWKMVDGHKVYLD